MVKDTSIRVAGSILKQVFRQASTMPIACPRSIAIVKPCCLGDVLMATAILKPLRETYPQAKLSFFVGDWSREVVANNPCLDEVISCGRVGSGGSYSLSEYLSVARALRNGHFDCCIVLERSIWMALLPFLAGIPVRTGLDSEGRGFALNFRVPCGGVKHEAERYLDCIRALGIAIDSSRPEFHPSDRDRERARSILPEIGPTSPIAAIHPGGGANPGMTLTAKRWLPERFAAVADLLVQEFGATIVLLGAAQEPELAGVVQRAMKFPAIDLTGKTDLGEMAAVLELCQLFLGNDTGPMHLATAVGTPVVAMFGPSDPRVYGPYSSSATAVGGGLSCSPCFNRGWAPTCTDARCMREISVEQVWTAVREQIKVSAERRRLEVRPH